MSPASSRASCHPADRRSQEDLVVETRGTGRPMGLVADCLKDGATAAERGSLATG
ncbi:MAG: hypothetical protein ACKO28_03450 [Cyanobium sp.]